MAKTKITDKDIEDSIVKDFGKVIEEASFLRERRNKIIPVSPNLDVGLCGGIPEGSSVIISGKPSLGKTSLALQIAANAQKVDSDFGRRDVYYFDIEGRIKTRDFNGQPKLDQSPERLKIICSKDGHILSGEDFLDIGERLINSKRGCVFVFDSFSAICTSSRMEGKIGDRFRDDAPLLMSNFLKRINQVIPVNKSIVIGINHIIANQGPGMKTTMEAGGNKIQYQADVKLTGLFARKWEKPGIENPVGNEVHWFLEKTALDGPPVDVISYLRFGYGYDEYKEIFDLAIGCGMIAKGGAWYSMVDTEKYGEIKICGAENFVDMLITDEKLFETFSKDVMARYMPEPKDYV